MLGCSIRSSALLVLVFTVTGTDFEKIFKAIFLLLFVPLLFAKNVYSIPAAMNGEERVQ